MELKIAYQVTKVFYIRKSKHNNSKQTGKGLEVDDKIHEEASKFTTRIGETNERDDIYK